MGVYAVEASTNHDLGVEFETGGKHETGDAVGKTAGVGDSGDPVDGL